MVDTYWTCWIMAYRQYLRLEWDDIYCPSPPPPRGPTPLSRQARQDLGKDRRYQRPATAEVAHFSLHASKLRLQCVVNIAMYPDFVSSCPDKGSILPRKISTCLARTPKVLHFTPTPFQDASKTLGGRNPYTAGVCGSFHHFRK